MAKRRPSGDGMVRKRDDSRWEGRIVVGHKENGDSIFRYVYAPTQKELSAKLRQHIDSYQGADLMEQGRMTLSEWLDKWLEHTTDTLRPNTLRNYRSYIENHIRPSPGDKQLARITPKDIQRFYEMLTDWIFPNPLKSEYPVNPRAAYSRLKSLPKDAGLPSIRFHDLRHPNVKPKTKSFIKF